MATVKLTYQIENDIRRYVRNSYNARYKLLEQKLKDAKDLDEMLKAYVEDNGGMELFNKAKPFMQPQGRYGQVSVTFINGVRVEMYGLPSDKGEFATYRPFLNSSIEISNPAYMEKVKVINGLINDIKNLSTEIAQAELKIINTFKSYPTVNSALKAHPELANLLPESVMERVNRKVEKAVVTKPQLDDFDQNLIKQVVVMNRLTGA